MPFDIGALGQQAAGDLVGTGLGLLLEKHNDKRQLDQQQKLTDMQLGANMKMSDYNYGKQLQMWHDTNFSAQMEEMRKAGINPALIYGTSGGGATTIGSGSGGGGISGGEAPHGGHEIMDIANQQQAQQIMQLELLKAQKANIDADTANKQAENQNIPLTGKNIQANTALLTQGVENAKAIQKLTQVQTETAQVQAEIATTTKQEAIDSATANFRKSEHELSILLNDESISDQTYNDKVKIIQANLAQMLLQNAQIKEQTKLTDAQIEAVLNSIRQGNFSAEIQANYPSLFNVLGKEVNDLLSGVIKKAGGGKPSEHRTESFK